jgi:hypothetical protein
MLPINIVHTYKGYQFKLSFREKQMSKDIITVTASYADKSGTHSSESTILPAVYETVKRDSELKDKICDSCLVSNGAIDEQGNLKSSGGAGNG